MPCQELAEQAAGDILVVSGDPPTCTFDLLTLKKLNYEQSRLVSDFRSDIKTKPHALKFKSNTKCK